MKPNRPPLAVALICFVFCFPLSAGRAQSLSLADAVRLMLAYEPELNSIEYDTLSQIEDIDIARSELLPQIQLDGNTGYSETDRTDDSIFGSGDPALQRQLGISIRQLLYDGKAAKNRTQAARNAMQAQQYIEKDKIEKRVVDLTEVYLEILRSKEQRANYAMDIANHEEFLRLISQKAGLTGVRTDINLVRSRLNMAKKRLYQLRLTESRAKARFTRLTGNSNYELIQPKIPTIPASMDDIDLGSNWSYLAATEALEGAEHRAKASLAQNGPKFYFDTGYSVGQDVSGYRGRNNEASAMIVGSWTLFDGKKKKATQKREHFQVGKYEELKRAADIDRQNELQLLWDERRANLETIDIFKSQAYELKSVVADFESQFTLGAIDLISILDRQSEYAIAQSELINAKYDLKANAFRISGIQGELSSWILDQDDGEKYSATDYDNPINDPIPVALVSEANQDKQERSPASQMDLMKGNFKEEGPTVDYTAAPMEIYYGKDSISRSGIFKESFFTKKEKEKTSPYLFEHAASDGGEAPSVTVKPLSKPKLKKNAEVPAVGSSNRKPLKKNFFFKRLRKSSEDKK